MSVIPAGMGLVPSRRPAVLVDRCHNPGLVVSLRVVTGGIIRRLLVMITRRGDRVMIPL